MMGLLDFAGGQLWKIATGAAGILSVVLAGFLLSAQIENRLLNQANAALDQRLEQKTADLAQSRSNVATLQATIDSQNAKIELLRKDNEAKLTEATRQLVAVQTQNRSLSARLDSFLKVKPRGSTLEQRILDVDARYMELLK
jgi:septal ring factor EnvC (AmiA/AmiB activator)